MTVLPSIRSRLLRSVLLVSIVWSLAVTVSIWYVIRHEVDELLDDALTESAQILEELISYNFERLPMQDGSPTSLPAATHQERLIWQVVDARNQTVLHSHSAPGSALFTSQTLGFSNTADGFRTLGVELGSSPEWTLYVAQESGERLEAGLEAAQYSAGTALAIGLVSFVWLRRSLRRELQPLADISSAVRGFDPLRHDSALPPVSRIELVPMHRAITNLGAGLAQHIVNERLFSAHAAHAMRTPLAGLDSQLAVSLRECPTELQPRLMRAREAATRLNRVVSALLALFRSGSDPCRQHVSMESLIAHLTFDGLSIGTTGETELYGDPDLIAAALMNLLDNAARHHASHVTINVARTERTVISVRDNGGGINPDKLAKLQAAIDSQSYADCTGLGLMLADIVARAHDGRVVLRSEPYGCVVQLQIANPPHRTTMPKDG